MTKISCRDVTKISSCWVNKTSRQGIRQLGIFFGYTFLLHVFSSESSQGHINYFIAAVEKPWPPPLNDSVVMFKFRCRLEFLVHFIVVHNLS